MWEAGIIISAGQKIEHYEIASFGTLKTFAQTLDLKKAVTLLNEITEQEKNADRKLTAIVASDINLQAMENDRKHFHSFFL
jgi:ferritin-like metal-binding protein YciE